jgi:hypothetical protein
MKYTWAENLFEFYTSLQPDIKLPDGVQWLYPQKDKGVLSVLKQFLQKYYNDTKPRKLLLGINPGRFGAGVTGVNFTAPKQLTEECKIEHPFKQQTELSAEFIYAMINAYGGPKRFYANYFIGSVCPLGFVKNGINLNYYDDKELWLAVKPFIVANLSKLLTFNVNRQTCICIGGEKNLKFLSRLNNEEHWFQQIIPVPHPRFIMQYRRKQVEDYIQIYLDALEK